MTTRSSSRNKSKKKCKTQIQTESENDNHNNCPDLSHLRKPFETSIFGLENVIGLFHTATKEVQQYLTNECEILYECRSCRTLFRSLANFIIHKKTYCRINFSTKHVHCSCVHNNIYEENNQNISDYLTDDVPLNNIAVKEKRKKNLNDILDALTKQQTQRTECIPETYNEQKILLENVEGNSSGKFQTVSTTVKTLSDSMKSEVMEIHNILDSDEAILGPDGKIMPNNFNSELICDTCNQKFSTKKTLKYHVKYKHNINQKIFPCPRCENVFANPWGVYRHLINIHKKTTPQVRTMRNQIQNSAIIKTTTINSTTPNQILTKEDENKQWLENLESDCDFQMCGGCGKRFERKAALNAHFQICTKRKAICDISKSKTVKTIQEKPKNHTVKKTIPGKSNSPLNEKCKNVIEDDISNPNNHISNSPKTTLNEIESNNLPNKQEEILNSIEEIIGLPLNSKVNIRKMSVSSDDRDDPNEDKAESTQDVPCHENEENANTDLHEKELAPKNIDEQKAVETLKNKPPPHIVNVNNASTKSVNVQIPLNILENSHVRTISKSSIAEIIGLPSTSEEDAMIYFNDDQDFDIITIDYGDLEEANFVENNNFTDNANQLNSNCFDTQSKTNEHIDDNVKNELDHSYASNIEEKSSVQNHENEPNEFQNEYHGIYSCMKMEEETNDEDVVIYDEIKVEENVIIDENKYDISDICWNSDNFEHRNENTGTECNLGENFHIKNEPFLSESNLKDNYPQKNVDENSSSNTDLQKSALILKAAPFMDEEKLTCLSCLLNFKNLNNLHLHMSKHFKLYKFQCIKCNFMSVNKESGVHHAKTEHKTGEDIILHIPKWRRSHISVFNANIDFDGNNKVCETKITNSNISESKTTNENKYDVDLRKLIFNIILGPEDSAKMDINSIQNSQLNRPTRVRNKCLKADFIYDPVIKKKKNMVDANKDTTNSTTDKYGNGKFFSKKKKYKSENALNSLLK